MPSSLVERACRGLLHELHFVTPPLPEAIAETLGATPLGVRAIAGGDINQAFLVELADGRRVFVKHRPDAPAGMFPTEARGLDWLRVPGGARLPAVVAVRDEAPRFLRPRMDRPRHYRTRP